MMGSIKVNTEQQYTAFLRNGSWQCHRNVFDGRETNKQTLNVIDLIKDFSIFYTLNLI